MPFDSFDLGFTFLAVPRAVGFARACSSSRSALVAAHGLYRYRPRHPCRRQGKARGRARRDRRRPCLRRDFRSRHRLRRHRRLPVDPDLLRQSERRQRLRAGRLHHRRPRRHGLGARRADRRSDHRRGGKPLQPVPRRVARPDRHLSHLHRGACWCGRADLFGARA